LLLRELVYIFFVIALQIVETVVLGSCDEIIARGSSYYDAFTIFPDGGKNFLYDIFSRFPVRDKTFGIYAKSRII
jgi:hypothetical protein